MQWCKRALYYFGNNKKDINAVLNNTLSGGVSINDTLLHIAQNDLPFGGVRASGMGQYHGYEGFQTFSKMKPVFYQSRYNSFALFRPPYARFINFILKFMLRH